MRKLGANHCLLPYCQQENPTNKLVQCLLHDWSGSWWFVLDMLLPLVSIPLLVVCCLLFVVCVKHLCSWSFIFHFDHPPTTWNSFPSKSTIGRQNASATFLTPLFLLLAVKSTRTNTADVPNSVTCRLHKLPLLGEAGRQGQSIGLWLRRHGEVLDVEFLLLCDESRDSMVFIEFNGWLCLTANLDNS